MVLDMFQNFSKPNVKIFEKSGGSLGWKSDKNELFFTIFDLKSSVSWLISLKTIHVDYYVLIIRSGRKHCNYTIWNIFQLIRRQKFTFLVVFDHFEPLFANCLLNIVKNWTNSRTACFSYAISMGILLKRPLKKTFT